MCLLRASFVCCRGASDIVLNIGNKMNSIKIDLGRILPWIFLVIAVVQDKILVAILMALILVIMELGSIRRVLESKS